MKEERLKLEEERKKLEAERERRENYDHDTDPNIDATIYDTDGAGRYSTDKDLSDDSFYDRGEFDGVNYRNS